MVGTLERLRAPLGNTLWCCLGQRRALTCVQDSPNFGDRTILVEGMVALGFHSSKTTYAYISHCMSINTLISQFLLLKKITSPWRELFFSRHLSFILLKDKLYTYLALIQNHNAWVLIILLLGFVLGVDALPLHLQQEESQHGCLLGKKWNHLMRLSPQVLLQMKLRPDKWFPSDNPSI